MIFFSPSDMIQISSMVFHALCNAFKDPAQSEPQLVANLVFEFVNETNSLILTGTTQVSTGGVFVHSRPLVACKSFPNDKPKSVEIGDLLLVRTLVVNDEIAERRAFLLQAKKAKRIPTTPDNKNQWHLYEQWPGFTYAAGSGGLKGKSRRIKEPDIYEAAKYLLIGQGSSRHGGPSNCFICLRSYCCPGCLEICRHYTAHPTAPEIGHYRCFANELVEFIQGNAGKTFAKPKPWTRGWDRVIQDLIVDTAKAKTVYAARATGQSTPAMRGAGNLCFSMLSRSPVAQHHFLPFLRDNLDAANNFDGPPNVPADWASDDNGGISIIEFVVEQGQD